MKRHADCFKGTDAVAWLVAQRVTASQEEAVLLGNDMLRAGLLHHVSYRHPFENKEHLYRCSALSGISCLRDTDTMTVQVAYADWAFFEGKWMSVTFLICVHQGSWTSPAPLIAT